MFENEEHLLLKVMDYCRDSSIESLSYETPKIKIIITKPELNNKEREQRNQILRKEDLPERILKENNGENEIETKEDHTIIYSYMNGVFYTSSDPQNPPLVSIGDEIKKGDVLGLVEVMKCFIEVKAEISGVLTDILISNEVMIEHGQPLFEIRSEKK